MSAVIMDGKSVAASIRSALAREVERMVTGGEPAPGLAVILCGDDPASALYVRSKQRAAAAMGIRFMLHRPSAESSTDDLVRLVRQLDGDGDVDAMLVQLPLPMQIDRDAVIDALSPDKDADGFHPVNFGRMAEGRHPAVIPCTPLGCMELLHRYDVPVRGRRAVVVGRSAIVGRPVALLLTGEDATVTLCHSRTTALDSVCREADILIAAVGQPGMIDAGFVRPGACVIDVGTTPRDGTVAGDVDRESVEPVAGWLSPVPGGVGPMTVAMLLRNTVALASARRRPAAAV